MKATELALGAWGCALENEWGGRGQDDQRRE